MNVLRYLRKLGLVIAGKLNKLSILIAGFCFAFGLSFAYFLITTDRYKASEMYIGNLLYLLDIDVVENPSAVSGASVTVPNEYTYTVMINISSMNPVRSKYKLQYKTTCSQCQVFISDVSGWNSSGTIDGENSDSLLPPINSKTVKVIIINTSGSSATVDFAVTGGYNYNSIGSVAMLSGYNNNFKTNYVDSSSSKILKQIVKDDTECVPTLTTPCYYGGEEKRNYITNNDRMYRLIGVYLIDGTEYVKMIQTENETAMSSYNNLSTGLLNYNNSLPSNKLDYLTGEVSIITVGDYSGAGGYYSYLNNGTRMMTNTLFGANNVFVVTESGYINSILKTTSTYIRPVLILKTTARVKNKGTGSIDNPYVIYEALSDVIIDSITIDGTPASSVPETGVYDMSSSCNGGTAEWVDRTNLIKFSTTESPISCSLSFVNRDMKFNITVNGVTDSIPTTGNYKMSYRCYKGKVKLTWDNSTYSILLYNLTAPVLCDIAFVSVT